MQILITGGAGYIGSVLVGELLKCGHKIKVLDNFMYQQNSLLDLCYNPHLEIIRGDVRDHKLLSSHCKSCDLIIPLACLTGAPICDQDPWSAQAVNYEAIKYIVDNKSKDQMVIYPTTNSGYGLGTGEMFCTEDTPLNPISHYGILKTQAEKDVLSKENTLAFRLATVFGISPRMRLDLLVNDFVYRALNDRFLVLFEGHFKRNYVHVRDVVRCFIHSIENFKAMSGEVYNVGISDANLSKTELCNLIKSEIPSFVFFEAKLSEDKDKRNYIVSNQKIEKSGFKTSFDLHLGIRELVKGYTILQNKSHRNY